MGIYKPVIDIFGNAGSATKLANDSGIAPSYSCRAWVNFNGMGTVAIRASKNVSSITDLGVGYYTVNFTNAMTDTNYSVQSNASDNGSARSTTNLTTRTVSAATIDTSANGSNIAQDSAIVCVSIFS
jgi:hypothetical protein